MPRKKKTESAPTTEAVTEAVKETAEVSVPADKPANKKAPAKKKAASAKAETVAEAPAAAEKPAKKAPAKKTTSKAKTATKTAAAPKEVVKLQFGSDEYDLADIKKAVEADYKGKYKGRVKSVEIYVKPEEKAAYYVVNSDFSDKIEL